MAATTKSAVAAAAAEFDYAAIADDCTFGNAMDRARAERLGLQALAEKMGAVGDPTHQPCVGYGPNFIWGGEGDVDHVYLSYHVVGDLDPTGYVMHTYGYCVHWDHYDCRRALDD